MSKNKVYVVSMYRFGADDTHSYVLCVATKKTKAEGEADAEEARRGNEKYSAEIIEFTPNEPDSKKVIRERKLASYYDPHARVKDI